MFRHALLCTLCKSKFGLFLLRHHQAISGYMSLTQLIVYLQMIAGIVGGEVCPMDIPSMPACLS